MHPATPKTTTEPTADPRLAFAEVLGRALAEAWLRAGRDSSRPDAQGRPATAPNPRRPETPRRSLTG